MRVLLALAMTLALITIAGAQSQNLRIDNSGGRDVTVTLFSTRDVRDLTLTPIGAPAWIAECSTCAHRILTAPMHFSGQSELFAGGTLRVTDIASGEQKTAVGLWHVKSIAGTLDIVLTLPSERYVAAVLSAETDAKEPEESLRAMAVVARTYALSGPHYAVPAGHLKADLCDSTECQAARFGAVSSSIEQVVWQTAGETLWFGQRRAEVYFSQSCGGMTEEAYAAWAAVHAAPYLNAHTDPYCVRRNASGWHTEIKPSELAAIATTQHWRLPTEIVAVKVTKRGAGHRALLLEFAGPSGNRSQVSASALRLAIGRALGWSKVRSDWYEIGVRNGALIFDGRGFGHGVGLCQFGATEMAVEHKSAREILAFYFPGTRAGIGPDDGGWITDSVAGVAVRSARQLTPQQREETEASWQQAKTMFVPRASVTPEIVFAPSAELFRQMTSQPGWMLASTSGSRIVINAKATPGLKLQKTLQHEMLHVLVESETSAKIPLWLREGLVEALGGQAGSNMPSDSAIESELSRPTSREASEQAHRAAGARVQAMISRYGLAQVRSWLGSGVPANAN
ncbi:stage II sporulation protein D [Granulicella aggregans]|uniref:Stage II sporulation protein D n=1 Tax=Granulicella aggregans TaxID=474949 RepID=A0A7W7Z9B7_9BACT|nr:SpoIID/LytB domain-containing protein [Granulicella aggregans]MBB5055620.1 stage II sporulation protein D [Granulicella aggregans]